MNFAQSTVRLTEKTKLGVCVCVCALQLQPVLYVKDNELYRTLPSRKETLRYKSLDTF